MSTEIKSNVLPFPGVYTPIDLREVRPFAAANLDRAVADIVAKIPADHLVALVGIVDKEHGGRVALLVRPNEHLSFAGYLAKPWNGQLDYGAQLIASW